MKTGHILLIILLAVAETACARIPSFQPVLSEGMGENGKGNAIINREGDAGLPSDFSLLEIGRALSRGAVDIYDPWLTVFRVTPPEHSVVDPLAGFPHHPDMVLRDNSVQVYTLQSDQMQGPMENGMEQDPQFSDVLGEVAPPVPLVEEEVLTP